MGMGFQFEQHKLGLWDLSWDLKKTISWEMGVGPPFTTLFVGLDYKLSVLFVLFFFRVYPICSNFIFY